MSRFNFKKATQLVNYLAVLSGGQINKMKAYKLIWLANRLHLRQYARTITGDLHAAMPLGAVPSNTKSMAEATKWSSPSEQAYFKKYLSTSKYDAFSIDEPDLKVFSKSDRDVITLIFEKYSDMSEHELGEFSHNFAEWKRFEKELAVKNTSFTMLDADFFENYDDGKGLFVDSEEDLEIVKKVYSEL